MQIYPHYFEKTQNVLVPMVFAALAVGTLLSTGCASTSQQASVGEVVDDSVITAKVKALFVEDKDVNALRISVETYKGTVQLSGFATNSGEIDRAGAIARSVQGVRSVKNDIRLRPAK